MCFLAPRAATGLDTIAYNVISNRRAHKTRKSPSRRTRLAPHDGPLPTRARPDPAAPPGLPRPAARWTPASGAPATGCPPSASSRPATACSLITVRRALSELAREERLERTRGRGTFVLAPRIDRDFAGPLSFTEEMQRRGLDPQTRLVGRAARVGQRGGRRRPRARARVADAVPRAAAPRRRRAAPARAGAPAGRAVPGPARHRPRARLALRPAHRALRRAGGEGPRDSRAGPAPRARGATAGPRSRARRRCSSRASRSPRTAHRSSSAGRSCAATGRATTWSASWCDRTGTVLVHAEEERRHATPGRLVTR